MTPNLVLRAVLLLFSALPVSSAAPQAWPARPVRIVVPFPPG